MKNMKNMKGSGVKPQALRDLRLLRLLRLLRVLRVLTLVTLAGSAASAQVQMPDLKAMSGSVLPVGEIPVGTITVRVVRGSFDQNIAKQPVEFTIDGKVRVVPTDEAGRATVSGLRRGALVRAVTVVAGERLISQDATVADSGLRIILVATDPDAAAREAESKALAAAPPVKGIVVLGGESRVVAEYSGDRLNVFYFIEIVNAARTPVDIGGPLIFDLPRTARGASVMEGSSKQATAIGPRVTVTGPFAPGTTTVQVGYELPYSGPNVRLEQRWPAALQETMVIVSKVGGMDATSPQFAKKDVRSQEGAEFILGMGPALAVGQSLVLDITGLPHHPRWPRYLALSLAGLVMAAGIWAAVRSPRV